MWTFWLFGTHVLNVYAYKKIHKNGKHFPTKHMSKLLEGAN